jgi:hypothetical protein
MTSVLVGWNGSGQEVRDCIVRAVDHVAVLEGAAFWILRYLTISFSVNTLYTQNQSIKSIIPSTFTIIPSTTSSTLIGSAHLDF